MKLNDEEAKKLVKENEFVVLDFFAEWCGPCKTILPIIENLSEKYSDKVKINKVDIEECDEMVSTYGIRNVPTILFFKNGEIVDKLVGAHQESVFDEKIKSLLGNE